MAIRLKQPAFIRALPGSKRKRSLDSARDDKRVSRDDSITSLRGLVEAVAIFSSEPLNENVAGSMSGKPEGNSTAVIVYSPAHSLSIQINSSLHSPPVATMCTSRQVVPRREQAIVMSAMGESLRRMCLQCLKICSFRVRTSGVHSSIRNTFLPPSPRRAGSM